MGKILEHWRISTAVLFSMTLIVGAYIFARGIESPQVAQASTEIALLQAISKKDSTGDGLPDWEKSLYGIPLNSTTTDYFNLGMTDGEAVARGLIVPKAIADIQVATSSPGTSVNADGSPQAATEGSITDTFTKYFFALYTTAVAVNNGADLSEDQISTLEQQAMNELTLGVSPAPDFKSKSDIKISGTGPDSLRVYAAQVESVFLANSTSLPKNELQYLQDAVSNNDSSALDNINKISKAFRVGAAGLSALTVPKELADSHLELVNAMTRLGEEGADFARVNTDPIATMLALQQYISTANSSTNIFNDMALIYSSGQVTLPYGTPGALFVNAIENGKSGLLQN